MLILFVIIASLLIAFVTVLLMLLISKTSHKKTNASILLHPKSCDLESSKFSMKIYDIESGACQKGTNSSYAFFIPTPSSESNHDSVFLEVAPNIEQESYQWLIDFFVENLGFVVVVPLENSQPEQILDRINQKKDADHGLDPTFLSNRWVYVGFLCGDEPFDTSSFIKMIYIHPPNTFLISSSKPVLIIDAAYDCYSRNDSRFPPNIKYTQNSMYAVRIYGTLNLPRFYATSCNWYKKSCKECSTSIFMLNPTCQKSITQYIIELFLTNKDKFEMDLFLHVNSSDISEIAINQQRRLLCLGYKT